MQAVLGIAWLLVLLPAMNGRLLLALTIAVVGCLGVGLSALRLFSPGLDRGLYLLASLPLGFVVLAFFSQAAAQFGWSLPYLVGIAALSVAGLWSERRTFLAWLSGSQPVSWRLVLLVAVPLAYLLPYTLLRLSLAPGAFAWVHEDQQFDAVIAAAVKHGISPPPVPGAWVGELHYHYGAYALAGVVARVLGVGAADSLLLVVRPVAIGAVFLSCLALAKALARTKTEWQYGALGSTIGLFFLGSVFWMFTGKISGLPALPMATMNVTHLKQFYIGHSLLWGTLAVMLGLALALSPEPEKEHTRGQIAWLAILLPALVIPMNVVAAIQVGVVMAIRVASEGVSRVVVIARIAASAALGAGCLTLLGFARPVGEGGWVTFSVSDATRSMWSVAAWLLVALGPRLLGLCPLWWLGQGRQGRVTQWLPAGLAAATVGVYLLASPDKVDRSYLLTMLQGPLGALAGIHLGVAIVNGGSRAIASAARACLGFLGAVLLGLAAISLIGLVFALVGDGLAQSLRLILPTLGRLTAAGIVATFLWAWTCRRTEARGAAAWLTVVAFALGGFAWVWPLYVFGMAPLFDGSMIVDRQRVEELRAIASVVPPNARIASNKMFAKTGRQRSLFKELSDAALAERPLLFESPWYSSIGEPRLTSERVQQVERIFASESPNEVQDLLENLEIRALLCTPRTDLAVCRTQRPEWLEHIPGTGDQLVAYLVTGRKGSAAMR